MINLFMDAQIWLSLYSFSSNDLKQFSKLKDCIANKEVNIIITDQIVDEVNRNRENKLHDVIDKTKAINFNIPVLYQGYTKEHALFKKQLKDLRDLNTNIQEQQAKTGLKKAINTLTEAAQMNQAIEGWDYGSAFAANLSEINTDSDFTTQSFTSILGNRTNIDFRQGNTLPATLNLDGNYTAVRNKNFSQKKYRFYAE